MLSIDIGNKKVCVIEGNYRNGIVTVSAWDEIEYKEETVVNSIIADRPALSLSINEIIKTHNMKSKAAVVTINSSDIVAREFKLPDIKLSNLKILVNNEMSKIIGEVSGYIIDFVVTGTTSDKMLIVMAYAVSKDIVESYYSLLKELKLTPYALDIQANSISKLFSKAIINGRSHINDNIIVADIGYSKLSFHGFSEGICRFSRTEVSPVQEFVREIGSINRVDVTSEDIAKLDLSPDYTYESSILADTCRYFVYRLSEEMQRYIQYITLNSESKSVAQIYIYGGIASINGIDIALTNSLKIQVRTIKSIDRVQASENFILNKICNAAGAMIRG